MPACFSMLLSVPIGISRTGCGTVTRPGFTGCLNCLWLPTCATSYQPSCFKRCMTSRLDIRHDTHFLHTCQVGVCRSDRREVCLPQDDPLGAAFTGGGRGTSGW